ncbi:hypothetical protein DFJ58DRAFT_812304 [Suillus subalutaceus]|uniref:uncharacterized protein n=1 Tax=Suillus subalutaceus TaxID=48586 RepID=UPI001B86C08C|nr:uncharacterized protein DFJ58DRAFT_812304 [Suillus subalutaceus]KAG1839463.1 hypothetical protein DFJ58DRAFT_812304 [Suillus subalutaceus]
MACNRVIMMTCMMLHSPPRITSTTTFVQSFMNGRHECGILTASVIKIVGTLSKETESIRGDIPRMYILIRNINDLNLQTYTENPIPA